MCRDKRTIGRLMKTLNPAVARVLKRLHYPLDVILTCVRWYVAYPLSLRHLEEMMAERGISVDHSTVLRWAIKVASSGESLSPPQEDRRSELANA
jgi:putative transposase